MLPISGRSQWPRSTCLWLAVYCTLRPLSEARCMMPPSSALQRTRTHKVVAVLALSVLSMTAPPALAGQQASVEMEEALAKYGPGVFPAVTRMEVCGFFRVMVVYWAGTDMLFVDEIQPSQGEST